MKEVKLLLGDNMVTLKELADNSVDSVVSDPPTKDIISLRYRVTEDGRVFNIRRNKELIFAITKKGYKKARLYCPEIAQNVDKRKPLFLHRLVAMFYLDDYSDKLQVNHLDGDKLNNNKNNLQMCNNSQNVKHAWTYLDYDNKRRNQLKKCPITGKFLKK